MLLCARYANEEARSQPAPNSINVQAVGRGLGGVHAFGLQLECTGFRRLGGYLGRFLSGGHDPHRQRRCGSDPPPLDVNECINGVDIQPQTLKSISQLILVLPSRAP